MSTIRIVICPHCNRGNTVKWRFDAPTATSYRMCEACGQLVAGPEKTYEYTRTRADNFQISYNVIDEIVRKYYSIPNYSFIVVGECQNDSVVEIDVSGVVDKHDAAEAEGFRRGEDLRNHTILDILCQDGWLAPGKYLVEVCW